MNEKWITILPFVIHYFNKDSDPPCLSYWFRHRPPHRRCVLTEPIEDYADALRYIYGFADYERTTPRARDAQRLDNFHALLEAAGNPHLRLRTLHVAGTKGKGSTTAMLTSILVASGYTVGTYTSPHLHTHRERYQLDGRPVSEHEFTALLRELQPIVERLRAERSLTTFEVITVLAFELFARRSVDWAVIEVGLGGRLDTTNVITPVVSAITAISLDHTEVLGHTLSAIAAEKAGIIKPSVPVVIAPQPQEARDTILARAGELNSPALLVDELIVARERRTVGFSHQEVSLETALSLNGRRLDGCRVGLNLLGRHQVDNALTAITVCTQLGEAGSALEPPELLDGLRRVHWPVRFEVVADGQPVPVVIDGAHNPDSVAKLRATIEEVFPGRRVACIFGALRGHDARGMLRHLAGYRLILTRSTHPRSVAVEDLAALAHEEGLSFVTAPKVTEALALARRTPGAELLLACGTLMVAAETREALGLAEATDPVTH